MKRRSFIAAAAAGSALWPVAARAAAPAAPRILVPQFPSAPYPHASRAQGHDYDHVHYDAAAHYNDATTGIVIPSQFAPVDGAVDLVVHFHGWRNNVATVLQRYRLAEQLEASGRNAVLVVPQGPKDSPDSGDGKLELDENGFARFVGDVLAFLATTTGSARPLRVRNIVLTAHSGGYGGAGGVLTHGGMNERISDVILFDAAYGYYDAFAAWAKGSPSRHLLSLFTDDTSTGNAALMGMLQGAQPDIFVRLADKMTLPELQTRIPTFVLTTSVAHDELMQKFDWYELFLQATALERRKT